jgi:uncharacterized protein involved in exopolysaccharide biosynthesis
MNGIEYRVGAKLLAPAELVIGVLGQKKLLICGTAVCMLAAVIVSLIMPETYESRATLLLMPAPFREAKDKENQQIGLFPKVLGVKDYSVLLKSDGVLMKTVELLRTQGRISEKDANRLSRISRLRRSTEVATTVVEKTAYSSVLSPAIMLSVTGRTPELARDLAQAWAEVSVQEATSFYKKGKGAQTEFLTQRLQSAQGELDGVLKELEVSERSSTSTSGELRINDMTTLLTKLEGQKVDTVAQLQSTGKEAEELRAQLAKLDEKTIVFNSPPMEALFLEGVLGKEGEIPKPEEGKAPGYQTEVLNPVYTATANQLVEAEKALKGLQDKVASLEKSITELQSQIQEELKKYAAFRREHMFLLGKFDVYKAIYAELGTRLEQAKIAEMEQESLSDIKIAADAVLPDTKSAPNRTAIVFLASVVGLFVSTVAAIYRTMFGKMKSA